MNIKLYITGLFLVLVAFVTVSCDDDLNSIGADIQPENDGIKIITDTAGVLSETILMGEVYARTTSAVLGKYEDPLFGTIKSEYLFEFRGADSLAFGYEGMLYENLTIDSICLNVDFVHYVGDSLAPMGVSAYQLTSPLKTDFYTNINPLDYCDQTKLLGKRTYTVDQSSRYIGYLGNTLKSFRSLTIDLDTVVARRFYDEYWQTKKADGYGSTFQNTDSLRKFFNGVYMASTFGSGSLINVEASSLNIFYNYLQPNGTKDNQSDTIIYRVFELMVTPEVRQLNSVQNSFPTPNPLLNNDDAVYLKTPAGVCAQVQFPLQEIVRKINETESGTGKVDVNSGKFILKGYSEKESVLKYDFGRPTSVLLIEKDSLNDFFLNPAKRKPDNETSFHALWDAATNSYSFTNLSNLITAYRTKIENGLVGDPYFVIVPVEIETYSTIQGSVIRQLYNYMKPSTSVLRNDSESMKFTYILSSY